MDSQPDKQILLAEFNAAHDSFHHYDSFRWQSGSMLIAGSLVLWGFVLAGGKPAPATIGITGFFISTLLAAWVLYAHHYRQLYMMKLYRIHQIENQLHMNLNRPIGFLGHGDVYLHTYGPKGHNLDFFVYIIVSLFGPAFAYLRSGFSPWYLAPLLVIVPVFVTLIINERRMYRTYESHGWPHELMIQQDNPSTKPRKTTKQKSTIADK
jgi:hypothetical protein